MSSALTHRLLYLESNKLDCLKDMTLAVLHTLIFNRSLGLPEAKETKCQTLNSFYVNLTINVVGEMWGLNL